MPRKKEDKKADTSLWQAQEDAIAAARTGDAELNKARGEARQRALDEKRDRFLTYLKTRPSHKGILLLNELKNGPLSFYTLDTFLEPMGEPHERWRRLLENFAAGFREAGLVVLVLEINPERLTTHGIDYTVALAWNVEPTSADAELPF